MATRRKKGGGGKSTRRPRSPAGRREKARRAEAQRQRKAEEYRRQLARKRAAKQGAETRKLRAGLAKFGKIRDGEFKQAVPFGDKRKNRTRYYVEQPAPGAWGKISPEEYRLGIQRLMDYAQAKLQRRFKTDTLFYSSGLRMRFSSEDDENGRPVWDDGDFVRMSRGFADFSTARRYAGDYAFAISSGGRHELVIGHYYRVWVKGIIAYALRESDALPTRRKRKREDAKHRNKRGVRPGNRKLGQIRRRRVSNKRGKR